MVKYKLQQSSSHYKILDARWVTRIKFHTEKPQILGATVQYSVAWVSWRLEFVHLCLYIDNFKVFMTRIVRNIAFWVVTPLSFVDRHQRFGEHAVSIVRVGRSDALLTSKWLGLEWSKHRLHVEVKKSACIRQQKYGNTACVCVCVYIYIMYVGLGNRAIDFGGRNLSR
jgi:hypothetical protein